MQHSVVKVNIDGEALFYICNPYDFEKIREKLLLASNDDILDVLRDMLSRRELVSIEEMVSDEFDYKMDNFHWREYWGMKKGVQYRLFDSEALS